MRRSRLAPLLAWAGAAATVLTCILWLGSAWFWATCTIRHMPTGHTMIVLARGQASLFAARIHPPSNYARTIQTEWDFGGIAFDLRWGFDWHRGLPARLTVRAVSIPLWAPAVLAGGATVGLWRWKRRVQRRERSGACGACGYDRAGLGGDANCPECGTLPPGGSPESGPRHAEPALAGGGEGGAAAPGP